MCVGVSVWLGWSGICVVVVLKPATRIPLKPNDTETPTHIEPRKNTTNGVIQQNSRKLLMMDKYKCPKYVEHIGSEIK